MPDSGIAVGDREVLFGLPGSEGHKGSFVQTLVLTDIATGWTECAPLLVREQ
jgi:hypothetical protein